MHPCCLARLIHFGLRLFVIKFYQHLAGLYGRAFASVEFRDASGKLARNSHGISFDSAVGLEQTLGQSALQEDSACEQDARKAQGNGNPKEGEPLCELPLRFRGFRRRFNAQKSPTARRSRKDAEVPAS